MALPDIFALFRTHSQPSARSRRRSDRIQMESLERRTLLDGAPLGGAALLRSGELLVRGTHDSDAIECELSPDGSRIEVTINDSTLSFRTSEVRLIRIRAHEGDDVIEMDDAIEIAARIHCGKGSDDATAGAGDDVVNGGKGDDSLNGGDGDDRLFGRNRDHSDGHGGGNDTLLGGDGTDLLKGGGGSDQMDGQLGSDTLKGGHGNDLFATNDGQDTFRDFNQNADTTGNITNQNRPFGPVTTGSFEAPNLLGTRTDLLPGAPNVNNAGHDNTLTDSFYVQNGYSNPPTYGPHHAHPANDPAVGHTNPAPVTPTGVKTSVLPDVDLVHHLEHGHVWISYNPALLGASDLAALQQLVRDGAGNSDGSGAGVILTPRPATTTPIALASWAHLQTLTSFDASAVRAFIERNRGHAPEGFITP